MIVILTRTSVCIPFVVIPMSELILQSTQRTPVDAQQWLLLLFLYIIPLVFYVVMSVVYMYIHIRDTEAAPQAMQF